MRHPPTHDFAQSREYRLQHQGYACLAIVDLGSYPSHAREGADRLDLLQHLSREVHALTAFMWETPDQLLNLRLLFARDHRTAHDLTHSAHHVFADGWIRTTGGKLVLAGHDRLLDSAGHRQHPLLQGRRPANTRSPHLLLVPTGLYAVTVFSKIACDRKLAAEYTIVLRHYPHPPPRLHPVRLSTLGGLSSPLSTPDWADSHKMPR